MHAHMRAHTRTHPHTPHTHAEETQHSVSAQSAQSRHEMRVKNVRLGRVTDSRDTSVPSSCMATSTPSCPPDSTKGPLSANTHPHNSAHETAKWKGRTEQNSAERMRLGKWATRKEGGNEERMRERRKGNGDRGSRSPGLTDHGRTCRRSAREREHETAVHCELRRG
jgi:hypothetical protein